MCARSKARIVLRLGTLFPRRVYYPSDNLLLYCSIRAEQSMQDVCTCFPWMSARVHDASICSGTKPRRVADLQVVAYNCDPPHVMDGRLYEESCGMTVAKQVQVCMIIS